MFKVVSVIGAGQMGAGIAQSAAIIAKVPTVILYDLNKGQLEKQFKLIKSLLSKDVGKGRISEGEMNEALIRIKTTDKFEDVSPSEFVIEVFLL